jgi:hypothetical protein
VKSLLVARFRLLGLALVPAACLAAAPAAASAQDGSRQDATLTFTETKPGVSTGLELRIDYVNPADPEGKPPAVRTVVTELAPGARYDTGAPELCTASDAELMGLGTTACPPGSVVGEGAITLDTGVPGPDRFIASDTTFLNNADELIFLNTERQSGGRVVVRSAVGDRTVTSQAPFLPGTPPDGAAIDTVELSEFAISSQSAAGARNYITTPPECPGSGHWTNQVHFTYYDGVTQTVETQSPCNPQEPGDGSMHLLVRPRVVTAGQRARLRFRVRGSDECRTAATIRVAGQSVHPDADGRARIKFVPAHPGVRHPKASSPGCDSSRARVRVK